MRNAMLTVNRQELRNRHQCRNRWSVVLFGFSLLGLGIGTGDGVEAREAEFEVVVEKDVRVPMRDGVRLATDLYLPARNGQRVAGRYPVILTRTPYDKNGNKSLGEYYAARGYVFVAQDTRGRFGSEGVWHWMTDDGPDGVDAASWIAAQAWSTGKIGMIGTSYVGGTQHALAMAGSPHLTTVIPVDAVCNMGYASMRHGGAFEMRF